MKAKHLVAGALWCSLCGGLPARAQFVPGHIFVTDVPHDGCIDPKFGSDRIWEIDPLTGDISVFVQLSFEQCGALTGLVFTPDGTRLRAAAAATSRILEFDSQGNFTVVLDSDDGISGPAGGNNVAYDAQGNFYVVNTGSRTLMRFPAEGGPGTVLADFYDGIRHWAAMAVALDGDVYLCPGGNGGVVETTYYLLRFAPPDWEVSLFDFYPPPGIDPVAVTADRSGYVYARWTGAGEVVLRYRAGDATSSDVLVSKLSGYIYLTMSPDQRHLYALNAWNGYRVLAIDVRDGSLTTLAEWGPMNIVGPGIAVASKPGAPEDFDLDGDADLVDFAWLDTCLTGPDAMMDPGCGLCDLDGDTDIDWADVRLFQLGFSDP